MARQAIIAYRYLKRRRESSKRQRVTPRRSLNGHYVAPVVQKQEYVRRARAAVRQHVSSTASTPRTEPRAFSLTEQAMQCQHAGVIFALVLTAAPAVAQNVKDGVTRKFEIGPSEDA